MRKIMTLQIHLLDTYEIASEHVKIVQIPFEGNADGDFFQGDILPGAVDTQTIYPDGTGRLSARYTLRGKDAEGNACQLYIENTAELGKDETHPTVVTDSPALSFLMDAELVGRMSFENGVLRIDIFESF